MKEKITIELFGNSYELYYSTKTMLDVEKRCESIEKLGDWLQEGKNEERQRKLMLVLIDMINGGIYKHNCEVALGLSTEEKKNFMSDDMADMLMGILSVKQINSYQSLILKAMNDGEEVQIPAGVPEPDPDLADVQSEKNE